MHSMHRGATSLSSSKFRKLCYTWTNSISHLKTCLHTRRVLEDQRFLCILMSGGACLRHFLTPCFAARSATLHILPFRAVRHDTQRRRPVCVSAVATTYMELRRNGIRLFAFFEPCFVIYICSKNKHNSHLFH